MGVGDCLVSMRLPSRAVGRWIEIRDTESERSGRAATPGGALEQLSVPLGPGTAYWVGDRFDRVRGFVVGSMTSLAVMAAQSFARTGRDFPPALDEFGSLVLEFFPPLL